MRNIVLPLLSFGLVSLQFYAQDTPENWHLLDKEQDNVPGISLQKAYNLLEENNRPSTPVIVAVLDSGLDIEHEDIQGVLWTNPGEIAGNGIDDDQNGYIDDIHGWNFIGGSDGESLEAETLELTRIYRKLKTQFEGKNKYTITAEEREDYEDFLRHMKAYNEGKIELEAAIKNGSEEYDFFNKLIPPLQKAIGKKSFNESELKRAKLRGSTLENLRANFFRILERNKDKNLTAEKLIKHYEELSSRMEMMETRLKYNYSLDFNGREVIGDNESDLNERYYGNNDVTKRSEHGTHVSGIIGAKRNNNIGINGIADDVIIMPIRSTPMGDERDKDVANGIRYAVDNGAKIINMSFGKDFSPHKEVVDSAIQYAEEKGVLIVHGAGNDHKNIDYFYNYPSSLLQDGTLATNWIEVGASSVHIDDNLAASFSNYGQSAVDIFAPGVDIFSTLPDNNYDTRSGTSMAAPVVSGVAALLLSYFPQLTPEEIKTIITTSGTRYDLMVNQPGSESKVPFSALSKTGKVINAYQAIKLALELYST
ncbi:peptidase S8 [Robertkochia marina]|uniref:Peptidase S8 n=1 Tax=Robertkochia marina TaxID=1227945 RepID=A0A4S3M0S4_9FLAO|nr:S8 family peptidase [Robertkochia marina]THD66617.1 peptidase S8 [Robertkochia marina]TRZ45545.1 peptidase S8 [Robertkochia marina]